MYTPLHLIIIKVTECHTHMHDQVIKSLEDSFETTRDELPSKLKTKDSIVRLAREVKQTSRKRKPVTSANFKKLCERMYTIK